MVFSFESSPYPNQNQLGFHQNQNYPMNGQLHNHVHPNNNPKSNQNFHVLFSPNYHHQSQMMRNTHHHHHPTVGQLSLSQRDRTNNSAANTLVVPQRVQLVQTVNIDYFPLQNQAAANHEDNGFCFTEVVRTTQEVVRTQLLNSATTRDRFLHQAPNHQVSHYGSPTQSQANPTTIFNHNNNKNIGYQYSNQCFNGSKEYNNSHYQCNPSHVFHQNSSHSSSSSSSRPRLVDGDEHEEDEEVIVFDVKPVSSVDLFSSENDPIYPNTQQKRKRKQKQKHSPPSHEEDYDYDDDGDDDDDADFNVEEEELKELEEEQGLANREDYDQLESRDGRTHSLPYKKYGPYTCPKCKKVFKTSQLFAAHMASHYKNETKGQRRRRLLAKYGLSKYLEMVKPKIMTRLMRTTTPHENRSRKKTRLHRRLANNNNTNTNAGVGVGVGVEDENKKQQVLEDIKFEGLFQDVKIKEE